MSAPREIQLSAADWERLREMRAGFLFASEHATAGQAQHGVGLEDYWRSRRDLEVYDATLGARIGWKWRAVIAEIQRQGFVPPDGTLLDYGCGSGVAARAWLGAFGSRSVRVHDRSRAARAYALERLREEFPGIDAAEVPGASGASGAGIDAPDVLLASHVLDELDAAGRDELLRLARASRTVVWVEAGAKAAARELSRVRDSLVDLFEPIAPCTHRERCGALAAGREDEWCHHFARPDPVSFTSAHWRRFSEELGVDLRALPYSYFVLSRRAGATRRNEDLARLLGRPTAQKGRLLCSMCDASGVRRLALLERTDKLLARALVKGEVEGLVFKLRVDAGRIVAIEPAGSARDGS